MSNAMNRRVLSLCTQGHREVIRKSLSASEYKVSFISALSEVTPSIAAFKPRVLVHDWDAIDHSQTMKFHLNFSHTTQAIDLFRVLVVPEITPSILAFASDALVEKVITIGNASLNLGNELDMMVASIDGNELATFMRELKSGEFRYDQTEIDRRVTDMYERYPHDPRIKLEFGNLAFRQGQYPEAENMAQSLLKKEPQNMRAMNLLAKCFMKQGKWEQSLNCIAAAQGLSPQNPERLILMGDALYGKGDLDKAMACYQEAIDIDPSVKDLAHKQMGQVHLAMGKVEEALELFKGSMSEEESAGFFNNAAVHAVREGKIDEAITLYNTALKALVTDKLKPFIYFNLALSHRRLGQAEEAVKCLKRALHYNPGYEKARVHLESILKPARKLQKAS